MGPISWNNYLLAAAIFQPNRLDLAENYSREGQLLHTQLINPTDPLRMYWPKGSGLEDIPPWGNSVTIYWPLGHKQEIGKLSLDLWHMGAVLKWRRKQSDPLFSLEEREDLNVANK